MVTASSSPLNGWLKVLTQLHATSLLHYALYTFASRCLTLTANFRDLWVVAEMNFRFWYLSWQAWHMRESYPRCTLGLSRKNASKPISVNASASSLKKTYEHRMKFKKKTYFIISQKSNLNEKESKQKNIRKKQIQIGKKTKKINKKQKHMNKFKNKIKRGRIKNEQQPKKIMKT
jgi:hypothetical protein